MATLRDIVDLSSLSSHCGVFFREGVVTEIVMEESAYHSSKLPESVSFSPIRYTRYLTIQVSGKSEHYKSLPSEVSSYLYKVMVTGFMTHRHGKSKRAECMKIISLCHQHYQETIFQSLGFPETPVKGGIRATAPDCRVGYENVPTPYEGSKPTCTGVEALDSSLVYDGRRAVIDNFLTVGVRIVDKRPYSPYESGHWVEIHTIPRYSLRSARSIFGVSDNDISSILTAIIARNISTLGATYHYYYSSPTRHKYGIGGIFIEPRLSGNDRDPISDILDAYVNSLRGIITNPSTIRMDPPIEMRDQVSLSSIAYNRILDGLPIHLSKLLSHGCLCVIHCARYDGYGTNAIEWAIERASKPKPRPKFQAHS